MALDLKFIKDLARSINLTCRERGVTRPISDYERRIRAADRNFPFTRFKFGWSDSTYLLADNVAAAGINISGLTTFPLKLTSSSLPKAFLDYEDILLRKITDDMCPPPPPPLLPSSTPSESSAPSTANNPILFEPVADASSVPHPQPVPVPADDGWTEELGPDEGTKLPSPWPQGPNDWAYGYTPNWFARWMSVAGAAVLLGAQKLAPRYANPAFAIMPPNLLERTWNSMDYWCECHDPISGDAAKCNQWNDQLRKDKPLQVL